MSDMVCLECGQEMEYDWAPCQNCGWKAPEPWESPPEENAPAQRPILAKPRPWVQITVWILLIATLVWLTSWIHW